MKIGIIKEIKKNENRVALTPEQTSQLIHSGHSVLVTKDAGLGSGFSNETYSQAGAQITSAESAWDSELVLKVKEPLADEYGYLKGQILFTYLHLAGVDRNLTHKLLESETTGIAYETVEDAQGKLPLLAPMSAIAGSMATSMGNYFLARFNKGRGNFLCQIMGESHGKVVIIGDGNVGLHAARVAAGLGAQQIILFGRHPDREPGIHQTVSPAITYKLSTAENITAEIEQADLVVGAVLIRGKKAPHVITEDMVKRMPQGAVIVDVSIDQGGCIETSHPTTHQDPVFIKHDILHYCVANMPGAYPRTSTIALTNATWPYIQKLAENGFSALQQDPGFMKGLNTYQGKIANQAVAEAMNMTDQLLS